MEIVEFRGTVHLFLYTIIRSALVFFISLFMAYVNKKIEYLESGQYY